MVRLNDVDNAPNFVERKAARTGDSQRLKPQLGVIAAPTFALTYVHMGRFT
jgi:hypothetical protein